MTCSQCGRPLGATGEACSGCEMLPDWCQCEPGPAFVRLAQLRASLLDSAALDSIPAPQPVIDGLLYRDGIAWLYGKPGTYKSVIAIDWASCVSVGLPWQGRETAQGPVLYVYIEGMSGLRQRVRAWEDRAACKTGVIFQPVAVQLLNPVDLAAFKMLVAELQPALVVIDTQARVTVGVEENSAMEMGKVVDAAGAIYRVCRSCVLILHHEARAGETPRGSIAIDGAATSLFRAERDGTRITLKNSRQRDTAEADDAILYAVPRLDSVVMESHAPVRLAGFGHELTDSEQKIMDTLRDSFRDSEVHAGNLREMTGQTKPTFFRAIDSLVSAGKVIRQGDKGRYRYSLPAGRVPLSLTQSHETGESRVSVSPPFKEERGVRLQDSRDSHLSEVSEPSGNSEPWPAESHGEAAGQ